MPTRTTVEIKVPHRTYVHALVKRCPDLTIKKARILEHDRSQYVTPTTLNDFFDKLQGLFEVGDYSPSMICNFDETMIQCASRRLTVVGPRTSKTLYIPEQAEMPHITLGVAIFADCSYPESLVIYPRKTLPQEVTAEWLVRYRKICYTGQPKGWITAEILEKYLLEIVLPYFLLQRARIGSSHRGLLLVDGHASRINAKLWQSFRDNDIDVITFVSHASHVMQPLDLCPFSVFKAQLRQGVSVMRKMTLPERRQFVMTHAFDALHIALSPSNIAAGFRKAGVVPLDRAVPLSHSAVNRDPNTPPRPIRKRKTTINLNGDILTSQDSLQKIKNDQANTAARKAKVVKRGRKTTKKADEETPYDQMEEETDDYSEYSDDA